MKRFFALFTLLLTLSWGGIHAGNFRLYVDDPTKVDLMMAMSFNYLTGLIPEEWNDVEFGDNDVELVVRSLGGNGCYSVKKDGADIAQSGTLYKVPLTEGCSIEILTEFPSESYPVEFVFVGCMEDCISSLEVNYRQVDDFLAPGFTVPAGSKLSFTGNSNDYKFDMLKVNGEEVDYDLSYGYTTLVTGPLEFEITAHRYRDFNVIISIDNPDGVTLMRDKTTTPIRLKSGENTVVFNEKNPRVVVSPNEGFKLTLLRSADRDYLPYYNEYNQDVSVEEGMRLEIGVAPLEIITNVIYFDSVESLGERDLVNASWEDYEFSQGYNVYSLFEGSNSFLFFPSATPAGVYLNGMRQESKYDSWQAYEFTPVENDVIKVFMLSVPEVYNVTFETSGAEVPCKVLHDMIVPVDDLSSPLELLGSTLLTIEPEDEAHSFSVMANDVEVTPDINGVYNIEVREDTSVRLGYTTSEAGLAFNDEKVYGNVYNLQGIMIVSGATDEQIRMLPAGLYIIDGRKVQIRH